MLRINMRCVVLIAVALGMYGSCLVAKVKDSGKDRHSENAKQKYSNMGSINAALEHVPYLAMRFAMAVKRAKELIYEIEHTEAVNKQRSGSYDQKICTLLEPIKDFLMIAREQRLAMKPLFKQILQGELQEKAIPATKHFASRLVAFCDGVDKHAHDYFAKSINNNEELVELCDEIVIVFGAILHDMTEAAQKQYDADRDAVRSIMLRSSHP